MNSMQSYQGKSLFSYQAFLTYKQCQLHINSARREEIEAFPCYAGRAESSTYSSHSKRFPPEESWSDGAARAGKPARQEETFAPVTLICFVPGTLLQDARSRIESLSQAWQDA
jgi:hypothetical protein